MRVKDLEIGPCEVLGEDGFARLRRCRVANIREDDTRSTEYLVDVVERPSGADAVAVVPYQRGCDGSVRVVLRRGLRPALRLGRAGHPPRDGEQPPLHHLEVVAGILEPGDRGAGGLRRRAAQELAEELGLRVDPGAVVELGPPVYLSPGLMAERVYYCAVEADLAGVGQGRGDGSPMEEGGEVVVLDLAEAVAACASGEIQDAKSEVALGRLQRLVGAAGS